MVQVAQATVCALCVRTSSWALSAFAPSTVDLLKLHGVRLPCRWKAARRQLAAQRDFGGPRLEADQVTCVAQRDRLRMVIGYHQVAPGGACTGDHERVVAGALELDGQMAGRERVADEPGERR